MSEGFSFHSVCYPTVGEAEQAYLTMYPQVINGFMTGAIGVNYSNGLGDFQFDSYYYDAAQQYHYIAVTNGYVPPCVMPTDVSSLIPNNFILVVAVVMLWAIGFSTGLKR